LAARGKKHVRGPVSGALLVLFALKRASFHQSENTLMHNFFSERKKVAG
jgi:hypothetical protein